MHSVARLPAYMRRGVSFPRHVRAIHDDRGSERLNGQWHQGLARQPRKIASNAKASPADHDRTIRAGCLGLRSVRQRVELASRRVARPPGRLLNRLSGGSATGRRGIGSSARDRHLGREVRGGRRRSRPHPVRRLRSRWSCSRRRRIRRRSRGRTADGLPAHRPPGLVSRDLSAVRAATGSLSAKRDMVPSWPLLAPGKKAAARSLDQQRGPVG
jgi:hypothetical protein